MISNLFSRVIESLRWPGWRDWVVVLLAIGAFAIAQVMAIADQAKGGLGLGDRATVQKSARRAIQAVFAPALLQEFSFRVLLPHPTETVRLWMGIIWSTVSLALFLLYCHWQFRRQLGQTLPSDASFDFYSSLCLGILAIVVYFSTGSLWAAVVFLWGSWLWQQHSHRLEPQLDEINK